MLWKIVYTLFLIRVVGVLGEVHVDDTDIWNFLSMIDTPTGCLNCSLVVSNI